MDPVIKQQIKDLKSQRDSLEQQLPTADEEKQREALQTQLLEIEEKIEELKKAPATPASSAPSAAAASAATDNKSASGGTELTKKSASTADNDNKNDESSDESAVTHNTGETGGADLVEKSEKDGARSTDQNDDDGPFKKTDKKTKKLSVGTYCEGPRALFAIGLGNTINQEGFRDHFKLEVVSDIKEEYVNTYHSQGIPPNVATQVLDATKSQSYDGIDIACVIAPYSNTTQGTTYLCRDIAEAIKASKVKYVLLGSRHDVNGDPRLGQPEIYNPFCNAFALALLDVASKKLPVPATLVPKDFCSIAPEYKHRFTRNGEKLDNLRSAFMYLSLFNVQEPLDENPRTLEPQSALVFPNPLQELLRVIKNHEMSQ